MNEQLINEQYQYILRLIGQKRLKEALTQLESFLWKCPEWSLRTRLEQIQTSYNYMLQYMRQGVEDPSVRNYIKDCWPILLKSPIRHVLHYSTAYQAIIIINIVRDVLRNFLPLPWRC